MRIVVQTLVLLLVFDVCVASRQYLNITDEEALDKAREILSNSPLVDGHNFLPQKYRSVFDNRVEDVDLRQNLSEVYPNLHTDIPRLRAGLVGAVFWNTQMFCTKQFKDATRAILEQLDVVHRMMAMYTEDFQFVTTAQGIEDAFVEGKIAGILGMEGGHTIDSSLGVLRALYAVGVRYLTLTHNCDTPWADANNQPIVHNGLTEFGRSIVREMNRLGMVVDLAHTHHQTMRDTLEESLAPVIFSHSNVHELCGHTHNVPDDVIDATEENGGMLMITFSSLYLSCPPSSPPADIPLVADHIEYVVDRIGYNHVGIGSNYDGGGGMLANGLEDTSRFPYLFAELVKRGWADENLEKLAGLNTIRVIRDVEQVRDSLAWMDPSSELIPEDDIPEEHECRTDFNS